MNAIVSVIGRDKVGICAAVCTRMAEYQVNILDITQTIMQGNFTMIMAVDLTEAKATFGEIKGGLAELGESMGLDIRMQRQEIFDAMHKV